MVITKQGRQNSNMTREQIEKQDQKNDVELGNDFTIGNTKSQSQKKAVVKQTKNNSEIFRGYFLFVFHDKIARVKEGVSK